MILKAAEIFEDAENIWKESKKQAEEINHIINNRVK